MFACVSLGNAALSTGWTWGYGAMATLPAMGYRLCKPLTIWGLLLKTEKYKEKIHALKYLQKT